jgi:hypothetical protein
LIPRLSTLYTLNVLSVDKAFLLTLTLANSNYIAMSPDIVLKL